MCQIKMNFYCALLIGLLAFHTVSEAESETICKFIGCKSSNRMKFCPISKRSINFQTISIQWRKSYTKNCIRGLSYGVRNYKIWVDKGCKALFYVCYKL